MTGDCFNHEGEPISYEEWARLHSIYEYVVVKKNHVGDYEVSTVWLGLNHNYSEHGPPLIFETMIFPTDEYDYQVRYATFTEALYDHERVVKALLEGLDPDPDIQQAIEDLTDDRPQGS